MKRYVLAGVLAGLFGPIAHADCRVATDAYNSTIDELAFTLKRYARCVSESKGSDDCSLEFRRLRNAQGDFESAVSAVGTECQ